MTMITDTSGYERPRSIDLKPGTTLQFPGGKENCYTLSMRKTKPNQQPGWWLKGTSGGLSDTVLDNPGYLWRIESEPCGTCDGSGTITHEVIDPPEILLQHTRVSWIQGASACRCGWTRKCSGPINGDNDRLAWTEHALAVLMQTILENEQDRLRGQR